MNPTMLTCYSGGEGYSGISYESLTGITEKLLACDPSMTVNHTTGSNLTTTLSTDSHRLVVFPGGSCSKWDEDLDERTLKIFKEYITAGGHAFMTCAGAYFAAKKSIYHDQKAGRIEKERMLQFFPGTVEGPIVTPPTQSSGSIHDLIKRIRWHNGEEGYVYIYGGGHFTPDSDSTQDYSVLATFCDDNKIAVIQRRIGEGAVTLSSVHLEFDSIAPAITSRFSDIGAEQWAKEALSSGAQFRRSCLKEIFNMSTPFTLKA